MSGGHSFAGAICTDGFQRPLSKLGPLFRANPVQQPASTDSAVTKVKGARVVKLSRLGRYGFVNILLLGCVHAHQCFDRLDHPLGVSDKVAVDLL
ncbi:hypothetical protein ACVI1J_008942 [Bradyrhizobium diazoefficiens]